MNVNPASQPGGPGSANTAKTNAGAQNVAKIIKDRVDRIEEIPDHDLRQQEVMKLLVHAKRKSTDGDVKKLLNVSTAAVNARSTIYSALKIAKITHQALINGCYGNAPLLAGVAGDMLDTVQFQPRKHVAQRLLKVINRHCDDPVAKSAYKIAGEIKKGVWTDTTGDKTTGLISGVLRAVAGGFSGSPGETLQLGVNLCRTALDSYYFDGRKLEPAVETIINNSQNRLDKSKLNFAWELTRHLDGESAGKYYQEILDDLPAIPSGDKGRLQMAGKALINFDTRERLSGASHEILSHMTKSSSDSNLKKQFRLARDINKILNPAVAEGYFEKDDLKDTSALVKEAFTQAQKGTPVKTDADVIKYTSKMINTVDDIDSGAVSNICNLLAGQVKNPAAAKVLRFTAEVSGNNREILQKGLKTAGKALQGETISLTGLGVQLANSFNSPYSQNDAYKKLFDFLIKDPQCSKSKNTLKLAGKIFNGYSNPKDKVNAGRMIISRLMAGETDKTTRPADLVRQITRCATNESSRFNMIKELGEELTGQLKNQDAKAFMGMAHKFVSVCSDYEYSNKAFASAMNKADELEQGKPYNMINDSLDVINAVPDKLIQANMLRKLNMKFLDDQIKQKKAGTAVHGPLEDLSALGETSTGRLNLNLDFLNILARNNQNPKGTYSILGEIYDRFPQKHRDIAAFGLFHFVRTDPGSKNIDDIRSTYIDPNEWKAIADTINLTQNERNTFRMIRKSVESIDLCQEKGAQGAISFALIREMENRNSNHSGINKIIKDYVKQCDVEKYRLTSENAENTVNNIARQMLKDMAKNDKNIALINAHMNGKWKNGETKQNRKLLLNTFNDLDRYNRGEFDDVFGWAKDKILGEGEQTAPKSKKEVIVQDDYVIIDGVILPRQGD